MIDTKTSYKEFLRTEKWLTLRDECLTRDGFRCRLCDSNFRLQAHHRNYPKKWSDTELDDLTTLCKNCHDMFHAYQNPDTQLRKCSISSGVEMPPKESRYKSVVSIGDIVDYKTLLYSRMKNLLDRRTFKEMKKKFKDL